MLPFGYSVDNFSLENETGYDETRPNGEDSQLSRCISLTESNRSMELKLERTPNTGLTPNETVLWKMKPYSHQQILQIWWSLR